MVENEKYQKEFVGFKNELQSFLYRLITNQQDVEDLIQDTFIKVFSKINSFKEESSFKTWVFSIAINTAKNHLQKQKIWIENAQDYGANLHTQSPEHWEKFISVFNATPEKEYEIKEHINYCFNCISKTLELKQQICLLLKEVYHFKVSEIMQITGFSEGIVKHAIADARKNMNRIFENRCSFVSKKGICHQCTELTGILNPKQDVHIKANKINLVKKGNPVQEELLDLRLEIVRSIDPLQSPNTIVNTFMLENCENWVEEGKKRKILPFSSENNL